MVIVPVKICIISDID